MTTAVQTRVFKPDDSVVWDPGHLEVPGHPRNHHGDGPFTVYIADVARETAGVHPQVLVLLDSDNTIVTRNDDPVTFTGMWFVPAEEQT